MQSRRSYSASYTALAAATLCLSCGGTRAQPPSHPETEQQPESPQVPAGLALDATFRELTGAQSTQAEGARDSDVTCSLRNQDGRIHLETTWMPAVTPIILADTPAQGLPPPSSLMLLTRWGASGTQVPGATVVAGLDGTQPTRNSAVILLGKSGPVPLFMGQELQIAGDVTQAARMGGVLYVGVYGDTKLSTLVELLETLEHAGVKVALAGVLPNETQIPSPDPRTQRAGLCEGEAPPDSEDADHDMTLLTEALRAHRNVLAACVQAHPTHFQEGGAMQVSLTLDEHGTVTESCVAEDTTDSPTLRQCVLERYRDVSTRASRGHITVTVEVPFGASPVDTKALCPR